MTPTARSLKLLRDEGYMVDVVEYFHWFKKRRKDLFNCWDLLAVKDAETVAVQTTTGSNLSARARKIADNEVTPMLRKAGWTLLIHGWRKNAKHRWVCKVVDVS